jgi:N-acetylglucosamine kinase-like BadF-type ATPase
VSRVLGLDIGGTHCRARLSMAGQVVDEAEAESASLSAIGTERAGKALSEVLKRLSLDDTAMLDAICAGSAGTGSVTARAFLTGLLAPLTRTGNVIVVNDARLVLPSAVPGRARVATTTAMRHTAGDGDTSWATRAAATGSCARH